MDRRDFLLRTLVGGAFSALPGKLLADSNTYRDFHQGIQQSPRLNALSGVESEMLSAEASIQGRWPQELAGVFYRNGPGRFERGGERYEHWFDGDGMVHAWRIRDGRVRHTGRFVRTSKFQEESQAGQLLYPTFGTAIQRRPVGNNDSINTANTNAVPHAGHLYALWEGGSATELDPDTLATRGIKTWRADLAALPFSAHPRIEPDGTLWNFGALPGSNKLVLWQIGADGSLVRVQLINVPKLAMVHDFVVTARYLVFLVPPFRLEQKPGASFLDMHVWEGERPMRAVIVDKTDFSLKQIIEMPAAMVFHFGNAFDDGDSIKLDATLFPDASILDEMRRAMHGSTMGSGRHSQAVLITLDLKQGLSRQETLLALTEFPRVAPLQIGRRHDEIFMLTGDPGQGFGLSGVARVSLRNGRVDRYHFGEDWIVEEHIPVAKRHGPGHWLIGPAYDIRRKKTALNVFDASHIAAGPVAQALLPYAAPLGFHGNFLAA
ncbi:carotenoid oxygenase family protein [Chitinimonas naiadis]